MTALCSREDGRPAYSLGLCRRCYVADLDERKARGEDVRRGPAPTASEVHPCATCEAPVKLTGRRLAAAHAGRPVHCSRACQGAKARVTLPCSGCATPVERYRSTLKADPESREVRVYCGPCRDAGLGGKPRRGDTKPCGTCGVPVYRQPSQADDGPRYCSTACHGVALRGREVVERLEVSCVVCGTVMRLTPDQRRLGVRTCKPECTAIARRSTERYTDADGYVWVTVPDGRRMLEHRWVMEQEIGRRLLTEETVHHRKGGKRGRSNNALGNLELWTGRHPKGHRVEDVVDYCREMLAVYGEADEQARYAVHAGAVLGTDAATLAPRRP